MLFSKLLRAKSLFMISTGEMIVDLVRSTFNFGTIDTSIGPALVNSEEAMRPDLLSNRLYASQDHWDVLLKFNGISNPFSLDEGEVLLAPSLNSLDKLIVPSKEVIEKGKEPSKLNEQALLNPKSDKDKRRLDSIRTTTTEVVPPNVNLTGAKNVKVIDGKVILGGDITQAGQLIANQATSRARVQDQLRNNFNL